MNRHPRRRSAAPTSWQPVSNWYHQSVGEEGHYYHRQVVIPNGLKLLHLKPGDKLLDLACGQGVLARKAPASITYFGVDAASDLINQAQKLTPPNDKQRLQFKVGDVTKPLPTSDRDFTHASIILALQNIAKPELAMQRAADHLQPGGKLLLVLNHPCFRIPRQSSWEIDPNHKLQYRRINRYLSPLKIPIQAHPGRPNSPVTWSFHQPLSQYFDQLRQAGFMVSALEEWNSDKTSVGKAANMENRSRAEFPMFMAILAVKA